MDKVIGIDVHSALNSPRGMGVYTIFFLKELAKIDKETHYILYGNKNDDNNVLPKQENFEFKNLNSGGLFHHEQIVLPKQAKKDKIDVLHSPANTSPIFLDGKIKRVITLHDVIPLKKEIPFPKNKRQILGKINYALNALFNTPRTNLILTVSNFSKQDIVKTLKTEEHKVIVSPSGLEHFIADCATDIDKLKEQYGIFDKYYFTLGGDAPSKNTGFLLEYFKNHSEINLVTAGIKCLKNNYLYNKYKDCRNIKFVPYISQEDIVGLYRNAIALVFPSIYEGLGLPPLEAMKSGCPCICSNASCLPEIMGDAVLYFNPHSFVDLDEKIKTLNNNQSIRQELINKGLEHYKKYSWATVARAIYEEYQKL